MCVYIYIYIYIYIYLLDIYKYALARFPCNASGLAHAGFTLLESEEGLQPSLLWRGYRGTSRMKVHIFRRPCSRPLP